MNSKKIIRYSLRFFNKQRISIYFLFNGYISETLLLNRFGRKVSGLLPNPN